MDEPMQARADRWKDWMGILVAVVALVTALAGWRAADAARTAGFEDYFALTAALNTEQAFTLSTANAMEHLAAFTEFAVNDELQLQLFNAAREGLSQEEQAVLDADLEQAARLAATNRNFFPGRYANRDGTYALARQIAELMADAERRQDLRPQPHLDASSKLDAKTFAFVQSIIVLSVSLLFLTLAGALHYGRTYLRWGAAVLGIGLLLIGAAVVIMTEFS